ncbi:MAG TPA: hypothetical protein VNB06_20540 [Thermoanaerobaculia bacterium]|nr:hypothetical protein [Thermoanaerobaculia bacterium]
MTPSEDSASATRDLAYVRELTGATRTATMISGSYFLLWGGLTSLGLVLTWLVLRGWIAAGPAAFGWIWGALGVVGAGGIAWLRHLSWVRWLGAALMLLLPGQHTCLVLAGMTLVGYTLPGWWLARGRWKLHGAV